MNKLTNVQLGRIGLSMAINYFTINGYTISLPLNDTQLDYIFAVNKKLECWLIPMSAIIESGNTKSFQLRTTLAPTAHPKLDTTLYRVQVPL